MQGLPYDPMNGEWISKETIRHITAQVFVNPDLYKEQEDFADFLARIPAVTAPSAQTIGSPHTQDCVQRQRTTLCAWVFVTKSKFPDKEFETGDVIDFTFKCQCFAGGHPEMKGKVRCEGDGEWTVGWLKPGAQMLE
ncbi:hypothetical protein HRG_010592 [Hirsutella rhossiliensis]|uniref:Uncharacterized protein n=1 Tax=Hirsutella rhossiliensis TaxID=111463 RepID=A0A9P8SD70_9HYPO|nr:uncharacterized protein HRG_10592 [Hirsutella rhossiliensis]KAH0958291.1 hypothetical protein HRG_10592 [Hirsutella rhossiliensis]